MNDHKSVIDSLDRIRGNEKDIRDRVRESVSFLNDPDGQWEQNAKKFFDGKPRYQFDLVHPAIKAITSEIMENEFNARVSESSHGGDSDVAEVYDGLTRSIQAMSAFEDIAQQSGRRAAAYGFDAWLIVNDWADVDAFDQDLLIKPIKDAINRVWLGPSSEIDHSDCREGFVLSEITKHEYDEAYPKGARVSVGCEHHDDKDDILIGDYYYIKKESKDLVLLMSGKVLTEEDYLKFADKYTERGDTVVRRRTRKIPVCYVRKFDGKDFLTEEKRTPFAYIPIIPVYGNYDFVDGKRVYFGETEKLKDAQRVFNYAKSREIYDGAMAPTRKILHTDTHVEGREDEWSQLNNSSAPGLGYNADPNAPPPFETGGPVVNPALANTAAGAANDIKEISSSYSPSRGEGLSGHSGVAYEMLQDKSSMGAITYIKALKRSISLTGKILVDAIPKVYDTKGRQVRLLNEDGTSKFESINEEFFNPQTNSMEVVRDLSQGHYDVSITAGPAFRNRKSEGLRAMIDLLKIQPQLLEMGGDIVIKSMDAPYIDQLGDRIRAQMIEKGLIPEKQLTDEEREKLAEEIRREQEAANQPDPMEQITLQALMVEIEKAKAEMQERQERLQLDLMEQMRKERETEIKAQKTESEIQKNQSQVIENLAEATGDHQLTSEEAESAADEVAKEI